MYIEDILFPHDTEVGIQDLNTYTNTYLPAQYALTNPPTPTADTPIVATFPAYCDVLFPAVPLMTETLHNTFESLNPQYKSALAYSNWVWSRTNGVCGEIFTALSMQSTTLTMMKTNEQSALDTLISLSYNYEVANNGLTISEAMYKALQMQAFDNDNTFMPTPLGLSVMDVNSGVCTNGVDALRQDNMMLVMEIEPIAEFKEWMEGRYGDQCDAWETSMYTDVMTANQNLLDTCINMRNDIMEEWYLLLVTMKGV